MKHGDLGKLNRMALGDAVIHNLLQRYYDGDIAEEDLLMKIIEAQRFVSDNILNEYGQQLRLCTCRTTRLLNEEFKHVRP